MPFFIFSEHKSSEPYIENLADTNSLLIFRSCKTGFWNISNKFTKILPKINLLFSDALNYVVLLKFRSCANSPRCKLPLQFMRVIRIFKSVSFSCFTELITNFCLMHTYRGNNYMSGNKTRLCHLSVYSFIIFNFMI